MYNTHGLERVKYLSWNLPHFLLLIACYTPSLFLTPAAFASKG